MSGETKFSKPFRKNGSLYRWMILGNQKHLQYYHRIAEKWLPAKDDSGFIVKPLGRRNR